MSEVIETDNGKTRSKDRPDRPTNEPVIIDQTLFDFLEGLFYEQPAAHPERIELRIVFGPNRNKYGPVIDTFRFAPANASSEAVKRSVGKGIPKKEEIVALSNRILMRLKQECDESRKKALYGVLAWNPVSSDEPYARWTKHLDPKGRYATKEGEAIEDDEEQSDEKKFSSKMMGHLEKILEQVADSYAGIMDRQDRMNARLIEQNDKHMGRLEKLFDLTERIMQAEHTRKKDEAWDDLRREGLKRVMDIGSAIAPPLLGGLVTKPGTQAAADVEIKTIKDFFSKITEEQAYAIFGDWNEDGSQLLKAGVLSPTQTQILIRVMREQLPTSELDKLVPGGEFAISMEQFMALNQVLSMELLLPLQVIFENHRKK